MKNLFAAFFLLLTAIPVLTAQQRYKHVPRVKVKNHQNVNKVNSEVLPSVNTVTIASYQPEIHTVNNPFLCPTGVVESTIPADDKTLVASSSSDTEIKTNRNKHIEIKTKHHKTHSSKKASWFIDQITKNSHLLKVKEIDKTNISVPLLLMIIFYILGAILLLLAVILFYAMPGFTLLAFLILLIAGAVFLIAASVMLTLFKIGVFS